MGNTKIRLIIFFAAKDGEALCRSGEDQEHDSDHELLTVKFRLKLKKVGKTIYDYTMEVTNGFKGLDLIDRVPAEL